MTENTETRTVQQYRHAARRVLTQARETLAVRTEATAEVYRLLNGSIEEILRGREGLSQAEQVEYLDNARATVEANRAELTEAIEQAKAEAIAMVQSWDFDAALAEALSILSDAREYAATRDFDAHQQVKRQRQGYDIGDESSEDDGF